MSEYPIDPESTEPPTIENVLEKLREEIILTTDLGRMKIDGMNVNAIDALVDGVTFLIANINGFWDGLIVVGGIVDDLRRRVDTLEGR